MLPRVNLVRTDKTDYLLFSSDDAISRHIHANGEWDTVNLDIAMLLCDGIEQPLVLDIGANLGGFAVPMAQRLAGKGGLIYAFEPQRIIYYQLCANIFLNRLDNCIAQNFALSDHVGEIEIPEIDYNLSPNIGAFSLVENLTEREFSVTLKNEASNKLKVPLRTLDSMEFSRSISLIKLDVEGLELEVLKGAAQCLAASRYPPLILEIWHFDWFKTQREELIAYLTGLGYELFYFNREDVIAQHPAHPRLFKFWINENKVICYTREK